MQHWWHKRKSRNAYFILIAEGDTFPLSVSEHNPSTQPAAVRRVPFYTCARQGATTTL